MRRGKAFQRDGTEKQITIPSGQEVNVWRLQPAQVEGMSAARRGFCASRGQMGHQQLDNSRVIEMAGFDIDGYRTNVIAGNSRRPWGTTG